MDLWEVSGQRVWIRTNFFVGFATEPYDVPASYRPQGELGSELEESCFSWGPALVGWAIGRFG